MKKIILIFIVFVTVSNIFPQNYAPGDNELLFTPTAYTMPAGNSYFTDYELYLMNYTFAVTNRTHIGIFLPFPVTTDMLNLFTFGIKQNYLKTDWIQSAAFLTYTFDSSLLTIGNAISIGSPSNGANLCAGIAKNMKDSGSDLLYLSFGYRYDPSENTSIIAEISQLYGEENDMDFNSIFPGGLVSLVFRIRSTHLSWDLGAFRPLDMSDDIDLIAFPALKVSYYFF